MALLFKGIEGVQSSLSLAPFTWFRVGGAADYFCLAKTMDHLKSLLKAKPNDMPVTILGAGSNVIIRDGGIEGLVIRLGSGFGQTEQVSDTEIIIGAGALDMRVATGLASLGLSGFEFLSGVPGTLGGAVKMNAGCYGRETADILQEAYFISFEGEAFTLSNEELSFGYRHSQMPENAICVGLKAKGVPGNADRIKADIAELKRGREESQPIKEKTGGSSFANPDPPATADQRKSWKLIDEAGMRGARLGGAQVSKKHCNFLLNLGEATASDLENLGEKVRAAVKTKSGVDLKWEIKRLGRYRS